jgi:hypothetical protein
MAILYASCRALVCTLYFLLKVFHAWASWRLKAAARNAKNRKCSLLEQMKAEHAETVWSRRLPALQRSLDRVGGWWTGLTSLKGRNLPYAFGIADASLVWLADRLGLIDLNAAVTYVRSLV